MKLTDDEIVVLFMRSIMTNTEQDDLKKVYIRYIFKIPAIRAYMVNKDNYINSMWAYYWVLTYNSLKKRMRKCITDPYYAYLWYDNLGIDKKYMSKITKGSLYEIV